MPRRRRVGKKLLRALLPLLGLLVVGLCGGVWWLLSTAAHPPQHPYLVTPDKYFVPIKVSDEHWRNADGTEARGWLLRGAEGAPAVVLLHSYGADRSWLLNLGVKINEATNCTVLWPDLRGHGEQPLVATTTFGQRESEDVAAAIAFLRTVKTPPGRPLVGPRMGLYGVGLGAYAALAAAAHQAADTRPQALALDTIPATPAALLQTAVNERTGQTSRLTLWLLGLGARVYFLGSYGNTPACTVAARLPGPRVLLLAGTEGSIFRESTVALAQCFPQQTQVELLNNLPITGRNAASAPGEQGEAYDRRVIEFFNRALSADMP